MIDIKICNVYRLVRKHIINMNIWEYSFPKITNRLKFTRFVV